MTRRVVVTIECSEATAFALDVLSKLPAEQRLRAIEKIRLDGEATVSITREGYALK